MGSPERLTREQYREMHSIKDLPDLIKGVVLFTKAIPDVPFYRAGLDSGFSILMPFPVNRIGYRYIKKGDVLTIYSSDDNCRPKTRFIDIASGRKTTATGTIVTDEQVIPDDNWDEEASALIEDSRSNKTEQDRWERYKEGKKSPARNPNWLEGLKKACSDGGPINDGNFF